MTPSYVEQPERPYEVIVLDRTGETRLLGDYSETELALAWESFDGYPETRIRNRDDDSEIRLVDGRPAG